MVLISCIYNEGDLLMRRRRAAAFSGVHDSSSKLGPARLGFCGRDVDLRGCAFEKLLEAMRHLEQIGNCGIPPVRRQPTDVPDRKGLLLDALRMVVQIPHECTLYLWCAEGQISSIAMVPNRSYTPLLLPK